MANTEFKIFLGLELEKTSKTTLNQEIKKLTENGINLKIGLDESSLKTLTNSIDNITKQLKTMSALGSKVDGGIGKGFEQSSQKAKDYADGLRILTEQYKQGTISAKEYHEQMNKRMRYDMGKGELNAYNKQLDPTQLKEYVSYLETIQSRLGQIKPIGELVSTKNVSTISNGATELIQKVETYTDKMGRIQNITSIVNKETGGLISSYETIINNSKTYEASLERQKTFIEKYKSTVAEISKYNLDMIKSRNSTSNDNHMIAQSNQIKKAYEEIVAISKEGQIVDHSKIEVFKRLVLEQQNLIKAKNNEIAQSKELKQAQYEQQILVERMQESFNKQNTKYSTGVTDSNKSQMQEMINVISKLNPLQEDYKNKVGECQRALNSYNEEVKESATFAQKQQVELNKQTIAVAKLQNALKNVDTKYSTGVNVKDSQNMSEMINSLSKMNPLTEEYKLQLGLVGVALDEYSKKVKDTTSSTQKQEVAINNQINTLEKFKNKLSNITNATKGSYNKQQANIFSQEIEALSRLNPLTEEYRKRVQSLTTAMNQFGVESKVAYAQAKGELTNYEVGFQRLLTLYKMGELSDEQFLKSAQSIRYATLATGELIEKQEFLNLSSQKQIQLTNAVARAQKNIQTENEKTKRSQQDLALYQEKMIFNLNQLKQAYASRGLDTSSIEAMITKTNALTVDTDELRNAQQKLNEEYRQARASISSATNATNTFGASMKNIFAMATGFYGIQSVFMYLRQGVSSLVTEVTTLDSAMINLSRVTDETQATYDSFKDSMFDVASQIGGTASGLIDSASEFAKLGFGFEEAGKLAQDATKYATAGEIELAEATNALSASYTVFSGQFDKVIGKVVDSTTIIDLYNKIGNTMAVTSGDIGEAMKASANSLSMANNSLSESVALIATANKTVQDASKVGNALRTISMRIRGVSEDGEELDAKLGETIASITKKYGKAVEIFDKGKQEFKSTYQIILELSEAWDKMTDAERAMLSEDIAGKNRAEVFMALMGNAEDLTYAMDMAKDSIGSVDEEVAIAMETFEKRVEVMKNAWASLAETTLNSDLVKGIVDTTTKMIEMTEACGGLVPLLIGLGLAVANVKFGVFANGIANVIPNLVALATQAGATTAIITTLKTVLTGGIITGGIMAVGYIMKSIANYAEEAKNKITNLKSEIMDLESSSSSVETLYSEFEKLSALSERQELLGEEAQRLIDVQNQLKEQLPEISGYYDSQGNFIIQNSEQIKDNIEAQKELIKTKKEALAQSQQKKIDRVADDAEQYKDSIESLKRYIELREQFSDKLSPLEMTKQEKLDLGLSEEDVAFLDSMQMMYGGVTQAQEALEYETKEYADTLSDLKQKFSDIITSSDEYQKASKETQKIVNENLAKMDFDSLGAEGLRQEVAKMTSNVGAYVRELSIMSNATEETIESQQDLVNGMSETEQKMASMDNAFQATLTSFNKTVDGADILKVALDEMTKSGGLTSETAEKLAKKYSDIFEGCQTASDGIRALNKQILQNNFDEATDKIADLVSILEDLEAGNGITASSFKKLSDNFPELLRYMNDEASLTEAIRSSMEDLKNTQNEAYKQMLLNSEEYYNSNIKGNEQMCNSIASGIESLFSNLNSAYQGDLQNWTSLAQGKADVEEQLINALNKAWEGHFSSLMTQFNKMANTPIATPTFDEQAYRDNLVGKNSLGASPYVGSKLLDSKLVDDLTKKAKAEFEASIEPYQQYQKDFVKANQEIAKIFDVKFDSIDIKVGGTKKASSGKSKKSGSEKYATYIDSLYSEMIDDLIASTDKLDRVITNTTNLMEQAQTLGNDGISSFANDIFKLREELEELSALGNVDLTVRPQVDTSQMKASGWDVEEDTIATKLTQGKFVWQGSEEDGEYVYVHYTPVLPDGSVLTPSEIDNYLRDTLEYSQNVLDSDSLGVVLKVENIEIPEQDIKDFLDTGKITSQLEQFLTESEKWGDKVYKAQQSFYNGAVELNKEGIETLIESGTIGSDTEIALRYQLEKIYQEKIDTLKSASSQIISLRKKIIEDLSGKNYSELKGIDLTGLSQLQLDKILKDIENQIASANMASNAELKANLEYKRDLIEDLGSSIIKANDQINSLAQNTIDVKKQLMDLQEANLDRLFEVRSKALDREEKILELRKSMLLEDGGEYDKEVKDSDKILQLNAKMLNTLVQRRKLCEEQIAEYRRLGHEDESEKIQGLIDQWLDYEQARLDMIKEIAETQRQNAISSAQNELNDLTKAKGYIKDLLSLTIDMLKQETEAKKEALKEQYDNKKESLKNEYDAEKDALKKKLDLLREEANARKEALDREKEAKNYAEDVAEKQKEISDIQSKITELSLDDSASSVKKRKELEAELDEAKKELDELQYNRSIELQKQAIDDELKAQEDKIQKELDNLDNKYNEEVELYEKNYKEQLKIYEDYLKNQSQLKADANALIESRDQEFYERLKAYAMDYTDTTQAEFEECWNKAYEALEKYGNKQLDVISIIETMTQRMIDLNNEIERLNNTTYKDFLNDDFSTSNDDYEFVGDKGNNSSSSSNSNSNVSDKDNNSNLPTEEEAKRQAQQQQQRYLHNQMVQAKASNNVGLQNWVKSERTRWGLLPETGEIKGEVSESAWQEYKKKYNIKTRHTGIETGFVGGMPLLKSNEEFNKLLKGELVINAKQMDTFMNKHLPEFVSKTNESSIPSGSVVIDMHDFTVTQDTLPKLERLLKEKVPKIINDQLFSKGIK